MAIEGYDLVMLGILAAAAVLGYLKGMVWQVAWIAGIAASTFVALRFGSDVAPYVGQQPPWNRLIAMLALYVATSLAVWLVFRVISGAINAVHLSAFDRQLGLLLGLAKGVLLCIVITFFSVTLAPAYRHQIVGSRSGRLVAELIVPHRRVPAPRDRRSRGSLRAAVRGPVPRWAGRRTTGRDRGHPSPRGRFGVERRDVGSGLDWSWCQGSRRRERAGGAGWLRNQSRPRPWGDRQPGRSLGDASRFVPSRRGRPTTSSGFSPAAAAAVRGDGERAAGVGAAGVSTASSAAGSERLSSRCPDPPAAARCGARSFRRTSGREAGSGRLRSPDHDARAAGRVRGVRAGPSGKTPRKTAQSRTPNRT